MRVGTVVVVGGAALLSACVAPIARGGGALPAGSTFRARAFFMADAGGVDPGLLAARSAVERYFVGKGFHEVVDAPYRVDVGFAVAPLALEVSAGPSSAVAPGSAAFALCRRRQYIVSVAMIDRSDGRVVFRNSATARRCARSASAVIPQLAHAALGH